MEVETPIVAMPVFLKCAPEELPRIASGRDALAKVKTITPDIFSLQIGLRTRSANGYLVNYEDYWMIYLSEERRNSNLPDLAARWARHLYPLVVTTYTTYLQMIDLVESLKVVEGSTTAIQEYISRTPGQTETIKRWPKNLEFSKKAVRQQALKDNAIVDAIKFHFLTPNFKFTAKLSRRGLITFYDGTYSEFEKLVIPGMVNLARENLERWHARARTVTNHRVTLDPLKIRPESHLTKNDLLLVREAVGRNYMTAVLYGGNPWLMLSLIDKADGSTLDLHAYENEIIITPVLRASAESLTRLYRVLEEALPTKIPQYA